VSDLTHSRLAETFLTDAKSSHDPAVLPIEFALVHATLAIARAVRELDTTVRQGFEKVAQSINGTLRVQFGTFMDVAGSEVLLDARAVQVVEEESANSARLYMANGHQVLVAGAAVDVSATIFQLVG
jgi:hypothetical protein